jgi:hypothetical protein
LNRNERTEWSRDRELAYRMTRIEAKLGITEAIPETTPYKRSNSVAYQPGFDWGTPQSRPALEKRLAEYTQYHHEAIHGDLTKHKYSIPLSH